MLAPQVIATVAVGVYIVRCVTRLGLEAIDLAEAVRRYRERRRRRQ